MWKWENGDDDDAAAAGGGGDDVDRGGVGDDGAKDDGVDDGDHRKHDGGDDDGEEMRGMLQVMLSLSSPSPSPWSQWLRLWLSLLIAYYSDDEGDDNQNEDKLCTSELGLAK